MNFQKFKIILPAVVFLVSFGTYVFTLNPSISAADSSEIVNASIVLGIPHQPSYPVNTILGYLFSKIPFGPLPWRVNLMSAVFQALTVTLAYFVVVKLYRLVKREIKQDERDKEREDPAHYLLAASSALFLAFSLVFWQYGTRAEVFPLNNFFAALATLILVSWWEKVWGHSDFLVSETQITSVKSASVKAPSRKTLRKYSWLSDLPKEALGHWSAYRPTPSGTGKSRGTTLGLLYLFAFVSGLALTHHQTIVLLTPAWVYLLVSGGVKVWFRREAVIRFVIYFIFGVLPYLSLIPMASANPSVKWGEPNTLKGLFKTITRSDYGTFSPYAQNPAEIEGKPQKETPITQQVYYFTSLNQDFTPLGLVLAFLGGLYLFRQKRRLFTFLFLGFFVAGPFFLGYANYTLDSGFHQAVAKRFQMMPNLFFALFLSFGLFYLWEKFRALEIDFSDKKNLLVGVFSAAALGLVFTYPMVRNFKYADDRDNSLTMEYARDSLETTPRNAIVLISGDITTFAFQYWRTIIDKNDERIVFSPGLLYLDWYVKRLRHDYPELVIPKAKAGHIQASTTEIVDANIGKRPIYISPELARYDPEVEKKYVLWPRHLLFLVKKKGEDMRLEPYRAENEAFWQSHNLKLMVKIRKNTPLLEYAMVPEYARHHFNIGAVFESVHLYDDAIREYQRALEIHPGFPDPYKNLGRIYGFELEHKDFQRAWENFNLFLTTALPGQQQDVEAVRAAMGELQSIVAREATKSGELNEASSSGSLRASLSASLSASAAARLGIKGLGQESTGAGFSTQSAGGKLRSF